MVDTGAATADKRRALTGAVLLDLAVSPLFAWDVFTDSLGRDLGVSHAVLAGVFSVGLAAFMLAVVVGGRAADAFSPRRLALVAPALALLSRSLAGLGREATDEEIAAEDQEADVRLGLAADGWDWLRQTQREPELLSVAEDGGLDAARVWLQRHGLKWTEAHSFSEIVPKTPVPNGTVHCQ